MGIIRASDIKNSFSCMLKSEKYPSRVTELNVICCISVNNDVMANCDGSVVKNGAVTVIYKKRGCPRGRHPLWGRETGKYSKSHL